MTKRTYRITQTEPYGAKVIDQDGNDLASSITGIDITMRAGRLPTATFHTMAIDVSDVVVEEGAWLGLERVPAHVLEAELDKRRAGGSGAS